MSSRGLWYIYKDLCKSNAKAKFGGITKGVT